jgi:8-oxo-dGTP pyrophosphatase MutT (NUDIX family)
MSRIRPIAICLFCYENKILVAEGRDRIKNQIFYRPLGGGIEFGERSEETIHREIREELNEEVTALRYLGTLENIFVFDGNIGHEIVQVYDGKLVNSKLYGQAQLDGNEEGEGQFKAIWKPISEFAPHTPLYPDGLMEMLQNIEN